jgi:hypothetical protein
LTITENPEEILRQFRGKTLWASLATLIDGEGSIMLVEQNRNSETLLPQYVPLIVVANTCEAWMRAWHARIGKGFVSMPRAYQPNHKQRYDWHIARKADVIYLLKKILPFLIVKRRQAQLVLELTQNKGKLSRNGDNTEELLWRKNIYGEMRRLNYRPGRGTRETIRRAPVSGDDIVRTSKPFEEQHDNAAVH